MERSLRVAVIAPLIFGHPLLAREVSVIIPGMRKFTLVLMLAVLSVVAFADSVKAEIESGNAKVCKFLKAKDIDGFAKFTRPWVTADFKHVENGKSMTFDEMVKEMKMGMGQMGKVRSVSTKIIKFKTKGKMAYATTQHSMVGETAPGPDKKVHVIGFVGTSEDVYRNEGGKWKLASMTWGKQKMTMDGKPFDPSKMQGAAAEKH